jgi:hypothetical protein
MVNGGMSPIDHIDPDDGDGGDFRKLVFNSSLTRPIGREDFKTFTVKASNLTKLTDLVDYLESRREEV